MEESDNKPIRLKLADVARRAKILENCHRIFQEICQQTSHVDAFPDFKFSYENVGNETEAGQANALTCRKFQYPHSPIEQKNLLDGEAELERKGQNDIELSVPSKHRCMLKYKTVLLQNYTLSELFAKETTQLG